MNTEYIIENLKFEILKPYHNISGFNSKKEKLNKYLENDALEDQKYNDRVTHLVLCDGELIAYFSIKVHPEGMPEEHYNELNKNIPDLPDIDDLPLIEIRRLAIDKKYDCYKLASTIFDNIIYNIENIFYSNTDSKALAICLGKDCKLPRMDYLPFDDAEEILMDLIKESSGMKLDRFYMIGCKED